jgi:hypothetical protein
VVKWPVAVGFALCFLTAWLFMSTDVDAQRAAASSSAEEQPVAVLGDRWIPIGGGTRLAAFASHPLDAPLPDIEAAVIVVHGLLRNADVYYANMMAAVRKADAGGLVKATTTLVVAPQFLTQSDAQAHHLPADAAYWTANAWKGGEAALAPASKPGSFAALDALVERLADPTRFPALRRMVVAGHSAGGQVLHRYAVVGRGDAAAKRIDVRFIVANPSSYLYLSKERPVDADGGFAPYDRARCPEFDDYRFGLNGSPPHVTERSLDDVVRDYKRRRVVYLLGTADNDPNHRVLDRSCAAMAQGPHRLARGEAYHRYIVRFLGPGAERTHRKVLVEGVGHDHAGMWAAPAGQAALFGPW